MIFMARRARGECESYCWRRGCNGKPGWSISPGGAEKPEYLKLNPNGLVPTLVHGDHVIYESNVITEYLDAMFPEPRLNKRHENSDKLFLDTLRCLVNTPSLKFKDLTKPEDDTAVA